MTKIPKIGLVLGAGGARGWAHLGVLRALDEIGVKPDMVIGCSMGALVGVAEAGGKRAELEQWGRGLTQTGFLSLVDIRPSSGGLVAGKQIANVLTEFGLDRDIETLDSPFVAVATELSNGREVWFEKGPVLPAIRASVAIPGLFSPQEYNGRWMVDGGMVNPVPVSVCIAKSVDVVIAVNPNAKPSGRYWSPKPEQDGQSAQWEKALDLVMPDTWRRPGKVIKPNGVEVLAASVDILTEHIRRTREAAAPADVKIDIDLQDFPGLAFYRADEAIEAGYIAAQPHLARIKDLCRERG